MDVAVVGGAVSGLAAADGLLDNSRVADVTLFERQNYGEKRVNCGEAINDTRLIPLRETRENGFLNDIDGFRLLVHSGTDRPRSESPLGTSDLSCEHGYICQRNVVERRWAAKLEDEGVRFRTGEPVSPSRYRSIIESFDYVIDATGQPSLTLKTFGSTREYSGDMVALNATVTGDFSTYVNRPRVFFEGYVGYSWSFPKSDTHANVGIGWAGEERPDDYVDAFAGAAARNGFPMPEREDINVYTIPKGPSLDPELTRFPDHGVFLVGDAAGIANRYQGEGICQGIRSARLLCDLIENEREETYPRRLYGTMKSEYLLARLMRGAWTEHRDPELLAAVAEALDGLSIDEITRRPRRVVRRILRHPAVAARLLVDRGMVGRIVDAYLDRWEYSRTSPV